MLRGGAVSYSINVRLAFIFFAALAFAIIPLPTILSAIRPPCVLLVVLYIQFYLPNYFSVTMVALLGLILDVLLSTLIGEHMFALVVTTWLASTRVRRFHLFSLPQQIGVITAFCCLYQALLYFIDIYQGYNNSLSKVLAATIISFMIWPWIRLLLTYFLHPGVKRNLRVC
jgi:rod shape-determining protein MreD